MATVFEERPIEAQAKEFDPEHIARVGIKAAARLLAAWKVDQPTAAALVGVKERTWARMKSGNWSGELNQDQRMRISALVGLYQGLHVYFSDELADRWVALENKGGLFKGARPLDFMVEGGVPALITTRDYIDAVRGGL